MNSNRRTAATLLHRDMVCLKNTSVNTLHRDGGGGGGDDDDKLLRI
jgi:hypothetical protein